MTVVSFSMIRVTFLDDQGNYIITEKEKNEIDDMCTYFVIISGNAGLPAVTGTESWGLKL